MEFTLGALWGHMGLFARTIVVVLGLMSIASLGVTLERILFFMKSKGDSIRYAQSVEKALAEGRLKDVAAKKAGDTGGYLGRVVDAGIKAFMRAEGAHGEYIVESVGRALERQAQREIQTLKRGQSVVATVSSTWPSTGCRPGSMRARSTSQSRRTSSSTPSLARSVPSTSRARSRWMPAST